MTITLIDYCTADGGEFAIRAEALAEQFYDHFHPDTESERGRFDAAVQSVARQKNNLRVTRSKDKEHLQTGISTWALPTNDLEVACEFATAVGKVLNVPFNF